MEGYKDLLRAEVHMVQIKIITREEMKSIQIRSAGFIFKQGKKIGKIKSSLQFDGKMGYLSDITDGKRYYSGFTFIPSVAAYFCSHDRLSCAADAVHCQGFRPSYYGTVFEVMVYDKNNQLTPFVSSHRISTESTETWDTAFSTCGQISSFDRKGRFKNRRPREDYRPILQIQHGPCLRFLRQTSRQEKHAPSSRFGEGSRGRSLCEILACSKSR